MEKGLTETNKKPGDPNQKESSPEAEEGPLIDSVGCTANVVYIDKEMKKIHVVNAGDSRCVMAKAGKVVELSIDHSPHLE